MALKFLNKKGWHTGSLRNVERVWKAEQKHDAEQRKLEELRKQIEDEREKSEFRLLQEQAGLVPRQERLEFLYDSGLAVGKGSSSSAGGSGVAFKALEEAVPSANRTNDASSSSAAAKQPSAPGALFEDKPHSANDAWRKLHSDPLLLIRQQEQQALARVKNNPVQMALIRKSVESKKEEKTQKKKEHRKKHSHESAKHQKHPTATEQSSSKDVHGEREKMRYTDDRRSYKYDHDDDDSYKEKKQLDEKASKRESHRRRDSDSQDTVKKNREMFLSEKHSAKNSRVPHLDRKEAETGSRSEARSHYPSVSDRYNSHKRRSSASKLSEEERAAKLREMQADAELHDEQRWKRLKKAEDDDARETTVGSTSGGRNFLAAAHRSVYGAGKGGSSTIEESVRRRTHYSQRGSEAGDGNAFRR